MNQTQTLKNLSGLSFADLAEVLGHMDIKISGSALGMRANRNNKEFSGEDMQKIIDACDDPTPETQGFVDSLNDAAEMIRYLIPTVDVTDIAEEETFENAEPMDLAVAELEAEDTDPADDEDVAELFDDIDAELDESDEDLDFGEDEDLDDLDDEESDDLDEPEEDDIDLDNLEESDDLDLDDLDGGDDLDDMGIDIEDAESDDLLDQLDDLEDGGVPAGGPTFADLVEDDDDEEFEGF